ncbi:hypothetical protein F0562_021673 [Nyssa sinensis]|uniref:Uncharacterized protein n=1 Tax=Nyssa sinensis TaxID=561372 RepID=A0A5J5BQW0_9ASTE|nr:hypothetical protein F0562_021673 [Nyssa sinensis]
MDECESYPKDYDDCPETTRPNSTSSSSSSTTSVHVTALDGIVNVNSLFTVAVFVGLSLTTQGQHSLENPWVCDAGIDVAKKLLVFEVVSFSFFLFSSLVAQGLKLAINLLNSKDANEAFRAHINLKVLRFGMLGSAVGSVMGCVFLMLSMVGVIQIRLGTLFCEAKILKTHKDADEALKAHINMKVLRFGMMGSAVGSVMGCLFLMLSMVNVIQIRSESYPKDYDDYQETTRPNSTSSSSSSTTSVHVTALDGLVNVNSLFTIAVFVGLSLTTQGQHSLENPSVCDAGIDVAKKLLVFEVVSFSFFLFSSLIAQGLKLAINLLNSKDANEAFRAHINLKVLRFGMLGSAVGSVMGCVFLMLSMVGVIQIRLGTLSCGSKSAVHAVATMIILVTSALLVYISTAIYAFLH